MQTLQQNQTDFTLTQCRAAIADFDQSTVQQAVVVMTSRNAEWMEKAANHPDFGRAIFWVREWFKVERIKNRREAFKRLKLVYAIRSERRSHMRQIGMGAFITLGAAALLAQSVLSFAA